MTTETAFFGGPPYGLDPRTIPLGSLDETWTVPAGVTRLTVQAGGCAASAPLDGIGLVGLVVHPGDEWRIRCGGPLFIAAGPGDVGGYNGGQDGYFGSGIVGTPSAGCTEVYVNERLLLVAGGGAGRTADADGGPGVGPGSATTIFHTGDPIPGPGDEPRVPIPTYYTGNPGGVHDGAPAIGPVPVFIDTGGAAAGGPGYGGGAGGGISFIDDEFGFVASKNGGSLVPSAVGAGSPPLIPGLSPLVPTFPFPPGYVVLQWYAPPASGWHVGRIGF